MVKCSECLFYRKSCEGKYDPSDCECFAKKVRCIDCAIAAGVIKGGCALHTDITTERVCAAFVPKGVQLVKCNDCENCIQKAFNLDRGFHTWHCAASGKQNAGGIDFCIYCEDFRPKIQPRLVKCKDCDLCSVVQPVIGRMDLLVNPCEGVLYAHAWSHECKKFQPRQRTCPTCGQVVKG